MLVDAKFDAIFSVELYKRKETVIRIKIKVVKSTIA